MVREIVGAPNFVEVFVDCPIEICELRDVKGLYKKARSGEIKDFTGIDAPYERPKNPDIVLKTDKLSVDEALEVVISALPSRGIYRKD